MKFAQPDPRAAQGRTVVLHLGNGSSMGAIAHTAMVEWRTVMKLWIGNMAPGTSDDEIKALVKKYGTELDCIDIQRVDGDGSRPAASIQCSGTNESIGKLALRLNGMYWKGRPLVSSVAISN